MDSNSEYYNKVTYDPPFEAGYTRGAEDCGTACLQTGTSGLVGFSWAESHSARYRSYCTCYYDGVPPEGLGDESYRVDTNSGTGPVKSADEEDGEICYPAKTALKRDLAFCY